MLLFCAVFLTFLLCLDIFRVIYKSQNLVAEGTAEGEERVGRKIGAALGTLTCLAQYVGGIVAVWALFLAAK